MNAHALGVLEFAAVLDLVSGHASGELGAERVRSSRPRTDRAWIELEHARVAAMSGLANGEVAWRPQRTSDIRHALARLNVEGAPLAIPDILGVRSVLRSSRITADSFRSEKIPAVTIAILRPEISALLVARQQEKEIDAALDDDGSVRDDASPLLRRVRRELRGAQGDLVKLLERLAAKLEPHHQVPDMSVTVRNGRFVIPVRREGRTAVGGIVHDTSSTGGTLFVEPPAAVEAGNRIRELEAEELREIDRILLELTDSLRPIRDELSISLEALISLDSLYARARFAAALGCGTLEFNDARDGLSILSGRHPLLISQGIRVVAFDLVLEPAERTLLISGPNTGGKTVLLKSLGLFAAMAQSGIPVPVSNGSRLAIFDDIYADVGDEQSISSSLSTFSAHLRNLAEVLRSSTSQSLVLIDELGSGTDPVEGAALGGAILEALTSRRSLSVATTHLGALKELATEVPGVVNASLQFDAVALAPTYRLIKGIPGRSYGLSIARRLQLPDDVLTRAEARLPTGERDVNALLAELENREQRLAERESEAAEIAEDARTRARRVAEREQAVRERERHAERDARREARRLLLDARAEVDKTIRDLKDAATEAADDAAREARRRMEQLAAAENQALGRLEKSEELESADVAEAATSSRDVEQGDYVAVAALGGRVARVLEIRDGDAVVVAGSVKLSVPKRDLTPAAAPSAAEKIQVTIRGDIPEVEAKSEIDLRGMRAVEIEDLLMQAVDSAVRADLKSLRIIHGKGTGALRERVGEMLRKENRVASFRLGAWNEGGAGVTIAELA
ncbi:MAG TPA: endonuclease MutS2 [Gemmatimonadaceae bacterium]|nr:endonuclease MutS2 [Gemmatimonadaceae bacterium]